jgi:hypothetical protein
MPSRSALNPVSFIRPGTGSILMPNDGTEPDPIIEKPPLIRDWHGGFLETDLSRHGVYVRMGSTWQKRCRQPKASRQKARAEGCDEPRGRPGKPQNAPSSAAEMARPTFHAQSFAAVVPLVHHKRPSSATGRVAA